MKEKKIDRNLTIDVAKGIGIFFVVLAHTVKNEFVHNLIYMFHMPLFFFLAGMTIKYSVSNSNKEFVLKKIKRIIIPYLFFCIVTFVYWAIIERKIRGQLDISLLSNFINIFLFRIDGNLYAYNIALWFLPCLFVSELIVFFMMKYIKNKKIVTFSSLILFIVGMMLSIKHISIIFALETALVAQFLIILGDLFSIIEKKDGNLIIEVIACILSIIGVVLCMIFHNEVGMLGHMYGNVLLFLIGAISGSYLTYEISKLLKNVKFIQFLGINSLIMLGFHEPIKRVVIKIFSILLKLSDSIVRNNIMYSIIISVVVLVLILPIILILNKFFPVLVGRRKDS